MLLPLVSIQEYVYNIDPIKWDDVLFNESDDDELINVIIYYIINYLGGSFSISKD